MVRGWADSLPSPPTKVEDYRLHLSEMSELVARCKASRDACKVDAVHPDESVEVGGRLRLVDYGWLRDTLKAAGSKETDDKGNEKADGKKKTEVLLDAASQRLKEDSTAVSGSQTHRDNGPGQDTQAKPVLQSVLAGGEFRSMAAPSLWERLWQRFFAWLDEKLRGLNGPGRSSRLLVRALTYGSILICLTLLVWWYVRQVRQQRIALAAGERVPHPSSASAVDWQQRLEQAQALAAAGDWRGAVHLIYWAAISRLEGLGNWPADRTRTPREYLQLLPATHRKRPDLMVLTRNFERIWYGRTLAKQDDFERAQSLLAKLVAE
jgi:hypothetical protein